MDIGLLFCVMSNFNFEVFNIDFFYLDMVLMYGKFLIGFNWGGLFILYVWMLFVII